MTTKSGDKHVFRQIPTMNSKYREVPRVLPGERHGNHTYFGGVSTGARALRDAELARARAAATQAKPTKCAWLAVSFIFVAVFLDAMAWATTAWGYAEEDNFFTKVGLWQICNGSLEPNPSEEKRAQGLQTKERKPVVTCVFPTSVPQDWIHKGLVMEIMGGFCAGALLACLFTFAFSLKSRCINSRTMIITIIPFAFLAALMNFIGMLTISLNLSSIYCSPSYSVALDTLGVVFFAFGGLCALTDIQGCFLNKEEEAAPPVPPIARIGIGFGHGGSGVISNS